MVTKYQGFRNLQEKLEKIYFSWNQEFHLTHTLFWQNFKFILFFPGYTKSCGMCTGNPVGKKRILWRKPSQPEMQGQIARQISTRLSIDPWPVRAVPVTKTERCKGAGGPRGAGLSPPIWTTQQQRVVSWWVNVAILVVKFSREGYKIWYIFRKKGTYVF